MKHRAMLGGCGLLLAAWPGLTLAQERPATPAPAAEAAAPREPLRITGTVMPRFHVVRYRGGDPSDTEEEVLFLRRARAQVSWEPDEHVRLVVEAELMDPEEPVRDAYARYRFDRKLEVMAGYFKRPFGATELDGVWDLFTSERGMVSRLLDGSSQVGGEDELPLTTVVAGRDFGVMLAGRWKKLADLRWAAGVWNGHGEGFPPGLGARLSISPGPLLFGVSAGWNRAPFGGMRDGAALGADVTLDGTYVFARAEAFVGSRMPVEHDVTGDVVHAQWAGGFVVAAARIPIPGTCVLVEPGGKVELIDRTTDGAADELVLYSPLVRTSFGEHFRLLVEGNFVTAGRNAEPGDKLVVESLVVQLAARI